MSIPLITLTTDFGLGDSYVAQMKGVMLAINPNARLADVTHLIPAQDVLRAAVVLTELVDAFPDGTIHLAVVDPQVGSNRRMVGVEMGRQRFVAPDNGLLALLARRFAPDRIVELTEKRFWRQGKSQPHRPSDTFHGRDIMAPVAAHWSLGIDLAEFGELIDDPLCDLTYRRPRKVNESIIGEVLWVDRFGNLITNVERSYLPEHQVEQMVVQIGDHRINGIHQFYGQQRDGDLMSVIGSSDYLEIAVNKGNASEVLQVVAGHEVRVFDCEAAKDE